MSLPDTVFIFVLALIIFGPKKLPEIGRQLGKLVGEFRRASNEFKFQIEEELRQVELADRHPIAPATKELETSASVEPSTDASDFSAPELHDPEETLPVGQYPNIDTVNPQDLIPVETAPEEAAPLDEPPIAETEPPHPIIQPAVGTEPRTTAPHTATSIEAGEPSVTGETEPPPEPQEPASLAMTTADEISIPNHEPADPYAAPAAADVTHG